MELASVAPASTVCFEVGPAFWLVRGLRVPVAKLLLELLHGLLPLALLPVALAALLHDGSIVVGGAAVPVYAVLLGGRGGRGWISRGRDGDGHQRLLDGGGFLGLGALDGVWVVESCTGS